ncbi:glutathione peroxidase [Rhodohalobacter mucosus]|uniref:Glutathione peroxidase n=1 Tax=Rhodohalobacter mucosus TaxID=2079485 RepID=A0A316TNF1_9BACT|nr:glutathione peroxidase [Rhodohalobacter mucosus]PWN05940.1 glutathione peroxidase [Rhodohalobacter mucosus]
MKTIILLLTLASFMITDSLHMKTIYEYQVNTIEGENILLKEYENDVILIVNTASRCGYTPQYEGLQTLYETYSDEGLTILGFPANNFGGQEPGTNEEIAEFCQLNYGVTFPMFEKVSVRGDDIHPLFSDLTTTENPDFTGDIGWNFEKFLVDRNGNLVRRFKSNVAPESEELISAVEALLK